jgi:hypothetical protein
VFATATVNGQPYALSRKRSTFGRDGLNLGALKDMTEGDATTPQRFWSIANEFGFTFNWGYVSRKFTSFFSSGRLPRRPPGPTAAYRRWATEITNGPVFSARASIPMTRAAPMGSS